MAERAWGPEQLAEIRQRSQRLCDPDCEALLARIDAQQAEIDRLTSERDTIDGRYQRAMAEWREAGAQVAALRAALERVPGFEAWLSLGDDVCAALERRRVLSDAEAAAREHDRRMRLEGAREFVRRWEKALGTTTHADVLGDMEREQ